VKRIKSKAMNHPKTKKKSHSHIRGGLETRPRMKTTHHGRKSYLPMMSWQGLSESVGLGENDHPIEGLGEAAKNETLRKPRYMLRTALTRNMVRMYSCTNRPLLLTDKKL
jgi:hypothetical protein